MEDLERAIEYNAAQARFYAQWNTSGAPWPRYIEVHNEINHLLDEWELLRNRRLTVIEAVR